MSGERFQNVIFLQILKYFLIVYVKNFTLRFYCKQGSRSCLLEAPPMSTSFIANFIPLSLACTCQSKYHLILISISLHAASLYILALGMMRGVVIVVMMPHAALSFVICFAIVMASLCDLRCPAPKRKHLFSYIILFWSGA